MFKCPWWDCPLENVAEYQQEDCEKNGMDCYTCMDQASLESAEDE